MKRLQDGEDAEESAASISLEAEQAAFARGGWLQERYYCDEGETVGGYLSFRSVYEINPFEVGVSRAKERADFSARREVLSKLLETGPLRNRRLSALSNGEMRRVLLARCLLRGSGVVAVEGAGDGLDPAWRRRLRALRSAMRAFGVDLRMKGGGIAGSRSAPAAQDAPDAPPAAERRAPGAVLVEMRGVRIRAGNRLLLKNFSWTIREGERWVLRGPNGSGKTMIFALVTGDSPFAYACDIAVFGRRRGGEGEVLRETRGKIGEVSSVRHAYSGVPPERQLDEALRPGVRLLLLDEPCCGMDAAAAERFAARVLEWLDAHPEAAAVWVEHRPERIPPEFSLLKCLYPV